MSSFVSYRASLSKKIKAAGKGIHFRSKRFATTTTHKSQCVAGDYSKTWLGGTKAVFIIRFRLLRKNHTKKIIWLHLINSIL